jgi:hypothetical protein
MTQNYLKTVNSEQYQPQRAGVVVLTQTLMPTARLTTNGALGVVFPPEDETDNGSSEPRRTPSPNSGN